MEKIRLKTRYGINNYLVLFKDSTYILITESPYISKGKLGSGEDYIDPSGGPFMAVGGTIEGYEGHKIQSIGWIKDKGYTITFEK